MIVNRTKKTVLVRNYQTCNNFFSRGIGLMFAKKITPTILSFSHETNASIHTFFVRQPIDVIFLNKDKKVVDVVKQLKSWRTYTPNQDAQFVVELPAGTIAKSRTTIGNVISFK